MIDTNESPDGSHMSGSTTDDPLGRIRNYIPRFADTELASRLRATGAVLIEGPRGCGKTQTALQAAESAVRLDRDQAARRAGELNPALLLDGERPRLIDEWQLVKEVWNEVRGDVDDHPDQVGRYILAGSAVPADDETRHTGSLRITRLRMRPMSLAESGHSSKAVSLGALFAGGEPEATDPGLDIRDIAERIVIGGWPALLRRDPADAMVATQGYLDETCRVDLGRLDGPRHDPENVARVLRSLARNTATEVSARTIAADVAGAEGSIDYHTAIDYIKALARLFIVEDLPAWSPALRSRGVLRSSVTRHFVDPSLAAAALGAGTDRLLGDPESLGFLFESLVIRDLRIYGQAIGATVSHYREAKGVEADSILMMRDGRWAALEVKLGQGEIDKAAGGLLRVVDHVDTDRHGTPSFTAVVTGWGYAYRRPDGVFVVPIGALAP
jgi:predicted AAA+ superfamily ATPase